MQLILASNSPRRRELLAEDHIDFTVVPSRYEEAGVGLSAIETVSRFSSGKAREVFSRFPDAVVLGADTVVALDGVVLGKPKSSEHAAEMLSMLSGRTHSVYTGVCLIGQGFCFEEVAETKVKFYDLSKETIESYVKSGLPLDKAGAYGIQDGYPLVESYAGSYTNVVGLPMELVRTLLRKAKYDKTCD